MTYRSLSLQELKKNYSDRPGFVFLSVHPSSRESCEKLYKQIKELKLCDYEPDFVNELEGGKFIAFVYPEGVSFDSGDLFFYSNPQLNPDMMRFFGLFSIDILSAFLKEN